MVGNSLIRCSLSLLLDEHVFADADLSFVFFGSKSLIKQNKSRIDVIRRKRNATQKFLKKDIADLLASGLDINAYGRVYTSLLFLFDNR